MEAKVMDDAYQYVPFYEAYAYKLLAYNGKSEDLFALMKYLHFKLEDWCVHSGTGLSPFL